jgi:pimeloyl-ACP methyl ester carboxylesterase
VRFVPAGVATEAFFRRQLPAFALRRALAGSDAPHALIETMTAAARSVSPEVMAYRVREILSLDAREALLACRAPILYLAGRRDRLVSPKTGERLQRLRPVECVTLDAPHLVLQRAPAASAEAIERFLLR